MSRHTTECDWLNNRTMSAVTACNGGAPIGSHCIVGSSNNNELCLYLCPFTIKSDCDKVWFGLHTVRSLQHIMLFWLLHSAQSNFAKITRNATHIIYHTLPQAKSTHQSGASLRSLSHFSTKLTIFHCLFDTENTQSVFSPSISYLLSSVPHIIYSCSFSKLSPFFNSKFLRAIVQLQKGLKFKYRTNTERTEDRNYFLFYWVFKMWIMLSVQNEKCNSDNWTDLEVTGSKEETNIQLALYAFVGAWQWWLVTKWKKKSFGCVSSSVSIVIFTLATEAQYAFGRHCVSSVCGSICSVSCTARW
jgi:hypothetical protein